jgi:phage FluMu protein Com
MAKIKIPCPECGRVLQCAESSHAKKVKCPHCKQVIPVPKTSALEPVVRPWRRAKKYLLPVAAALVLAVILAVIGCWLVWPVRVNWPDRRPIGVLFLAQNAGVSATNPRGWFNDRSLDFTGPAGIERFRQALLDYTDRSLAILKRTGAQGVIVWDLEGEQFPHKISFIGNPRMLGRLAPEMVPVVDEFLNKLRTAGLRIGLTVRPQELVFDNSGQPRQTEVVNLKQSLLQKIDYARTRWGATLFYVDSNGGVRRPDEAWQLRSLAAERPDILLIPEHHYLPYWSFSAPYESLHKGGADATAKWARKLYPGAFQVLDVSDGNSDWATFTAARTRGDILMFRAWHDSPDCQILEALANGKK